jgi:tRNA A37 threonylcarbamoyladenosine synthetase subunit TsaC/SUA5/YrdC
MAVISPTSGQPSPVSAAEVERQLGGRILIRTAANPENPSTLVIAWGVSR